VLVVITANGTVFGSYVSSATVQPVAQFSGAKIGFNPQDRFMAASPNLLMVVTQDGSVFGSRVTYGGGSSLSLDPVFQFAGAKIGFNPQDRFLLASGNYLYVVTNTGDVFCAEVDDGDQPNIGTVSHLGGAKIGYNPQDRFLVAEDGTLYVITNSGDVYGASIQFSAGPGNFGIPQSLGRVSHLTGAKIGYNPQDRFLVAEDSTLYVVTNSGDVYGAAIDRAAQSLAPVVHLGGAKIGYNPQDRFMVQLTVVPPAQ
jgi:hypothetical protein